MNKKLRILVACEFSGIVRDAFAARGHDAWSCDLLPSEKPGNHIQGNVLQVLNPHVDTYMGWDMIIAHPPCTYLCNSGVRWISQNGNIDHLRLEAMKKSCEFFALIYHSDIKKVCIENPVMHKYAREYLESFLNVPKKSQSFHPYDHGHGEIKRTCLWLRGLANLVASNVVDGRTPRVHHASPGQNRWKERSRTLPGIAKAMAEQWG